MTTGPEAGYYADPSIPGYIRYWDGTQWVPGTSRPAPDLPQQQEQYGQTPADSIADAANTASAASTTSAYDYDQAALQQTVAAQLTHAPQAQSAPQTGYPPQQEEAGAKVNVN